MKTLIVIPARLQATRLPNKPLAMIGDAPMIVQVWRRAVESGVGEVIVACDGEEIASVIRAAGGVAVITDPNHPSGSDRVWEAVQGAGGRDHVAEIIINLQGDVPTLEPRLLRELLVPMENPAVDIATLAAEIRDPAEHTNPSVVKVVLGGVGSQGSGVSKKTIKTSHTILSAERGALLTPAPRPPIPARALYFSRAPVPANDGSRYHHIGVYAYRRAALERFVHLPPSPLERREKLEQLRALEAGMRIDVVVVDTVPLGVDTEADLTKARTLF